MESLYRLKDMLCNQVDEIVAKNDITPTELDRVYKVVDVIKDISTIEAMDEAGYGENFDEEASYRGGRGGYSRASMRGNYRGSYDNGYSSRRGGRGSYRMSYDDEDMSKEHIMQKITELQRKVEQM